MAVNGKVNMPTWLRYVGEYNVGTENKRVRGMCVHTRAWEKKFWHYMIQAIMHYIYM